MGTKFPDYYRILGLDYPASSESIKKAYRRKSLEYHPDRNPQVNTTEMMVAINEAYRILGNVETKNRYDIEYERYLRTSSNLDSKKQKSHQEGDKESEREYEIRDRRVYDDINYAHNLAKQLVDEFLENLKQTARVAAKGAWESMFLCIIVGLIFSFLSILIHFWL